MTRLLVLFAACGVASGADIEVAPPPRLKVVEKAVPAETPKRGPGARPAAALPKDAMPLTGLSPSKPMFETCDYRYGVGTTNAKCQAFVDQGLGMYYSYVWIEAARSFETALTHDPECAYAWLMLHRSLEKWGRSGPTVTASPFMAATGGLVMAKPPERVGKSSGEYALAMAKGLMAKANDRERLHIQSRLHEKGMTPDTKPEDRRKKAAASLDELLMLHEDDEEGWFWRAQVADDGNAKAVYYKAVLKINPYHPGANHELVHFYENIRRPALGWLFAENYIKSSPGIPHAFHMQAHLGMRIGKWGNTTDWSWRAIELQKDYHKTQDVKHTEDHQFNHHMETLTRSLVHDGRFAEAKQIKTEAEGYKYTFRPEWFRMALGSKDWDEAAKIVEFFRRGDKSNGAYYAAQLYLEKGDIERARAEVDTLRSLQQTRKTDKRLEQRLFEVQGRFLCQTGNGAAGLKMLKKVVDATKNDFGHHAWGNGAVYMETWGVAALEAGSATDAEEAFQEALAHDAGSVRGALGLWALCDRVGRSDEAARYLKLAHRVWAKAAVKDFEALKADMHARATKIPRPAATTAAEEGQ
jgi:tetratricopeptide (TPR) repeat protein